MRSNKVVPSMAAHVGCAENVRTALFQGDLDTLAIKRLNEIQTNRGKPLLQYIEPETSVTTIDFSKEP